MRSSILIFEVMPSGQPYIIPSVEEDASTTTTTDRRNQKITNSSADLIFFDHQVPRNEILPNSLNAERTKRTFANNSWWFDLPLLMYQEMKISLFSPVVSIMDTTVSTANTIRMYELGMSEIEIYTRQEQYVPGSMVRSKLKN